MLSRWNAATPAITNAISASSTTGRRVRTRARTLLSIARSESSGRARWPHVLAALQRQFVGEEQRPVGDDLLALQHAFEDLPQSVLQQAHLHGLAHETMSVDGHEHLHCAVAPANHPGGRNRRR